MSAYNLVNTMSETLSAKAVNRIRCDESHTYWYTPLAGKAEVRVPGFSEICRDLGVTKLNPFYTESGRAEGISLHKWLQFLVKGKVSKAKPDQRIVGRVEGIKKFIRDTGFRIVGGEAPQYDNANNCATTPDLFGYIAQVPWVIDGKRGGKLKTHRLQTAAQAAALTANGFRPYKRGALYMKDGDYRLDEHTNTADAAHWHILVVAYHAMTERQREIFASELFNPTNPSCIGMIAGAKWITIVSAHNIKKEYQ